MKLIDFGNTRAHVWDEGMIEHMDIDEAVKRFRTQKIYYINVNPHHHDLFSVIAGWHNMDNILRLKGDYPGMGTDRKALCLSHPNGMFVDAGSAVTVDRVIDGVYQGGFIYPGFKAMHRAYVSISSALDTHLDLHIDLETLPRTTQIGVSYGTIAPIVAAIEKLRGDLPLYITGGDGETLSRHFPDAMYDEGLVFEGMVNALQEKVKSKK